eukprot:140472-Hanusia_phi.AAC.3
MICPGRRRRGDPMIMASVPGRYRVPGRGPGGCGQRRQRNSAFRTVVDSVGTAWATQRWPSHVGTVTAATLRDCWDPAAEDPSPVPRRAAAERSIIGSDIARPGPHWQADRGRTQWTGDSGPLKISDDSGHRSFGDRPRSAAREGSEVRVIRGQPTINAIDSYLPRI